MEIIILAGGFGTRLRDVVNDVPKSMASINGQLFLEYLLDYISQFNINNIILSVGYKQEIIKSYFGNKYKNITINYSCEDNPLGTGGAIKQALKYVSNSKVIVLNGDTLFNIDLDLFYNLDNNSHITLAVKKMENFNRYGSLDIKDNKVISFNEKEYTKSGFINAGIYLIYTNIFNNISAEKFSFEEFLQKQNNISSYISDSYFIDIGVPLDYEQAKIDFRELF